MKIFLALFASLSLAACGSSSPAAKTTVTVTVTAPATTSAPATSVKLGAPGTIPADWTWTPVMGGVKLGYPKTWKRGDLAKYNRNLPPATQEMMSASFLVEGPKDSGTLPGVLAVSKFEPGTLTLDEAREGFAPLGTIGDLSTPAGPAIYFDMPIGPLHERGIVVEFGDQLILLTILGPTKEEAARLGEIMANSLTVA